MKAITKEARGFIQSVMGYLRADGKVKSSVSKVQVFLNKVSDQAKRSSLAKVESAVALTEKEKKRLSRIISSRVGHPVRIVAKVNSAILGGVRVQLGDWIVDATLAGQLKKMTESIIQL